MTKEKQIEEMARTFLLKCHRVECLGNCTPCGKCTSYYYAETLYNEGYRKQMAGEWIRYPHGSGIYCSLCKHKRRYRDIHDAYFPNCGASMTRGRTDE